MKIVAASSPRCCSAQRCWSACAGIPSSGPVSRSPTTPTSGQSAVRYSPARPLPGASPEQIVRGYLDAMLAFPASSRTASAFLTPGGSTQVVRVARGVQVYSEPDVVGSPDRVDRGASEVQPPGPQTVRIGFTVDAELDAQGRYTPARHRRSAGLPAGAGRGAVAHRQPAGRPAGQPQVLRRLLPDVQPVLLRSAGPTPRARPGAPRGRRPARDDPDDEPGRGAAGRSPRPTRTYVPDGAGAAPVGAGLRGRGGRCRVHPGPARPERLGARSPVGADRLDAASGAGGATGADRRTLHGADRQRRRGAAGAGVGRLRAEHGPRTGLRGHRASGRRDRRRRGRARSAVRGARTPAAPGSSPSPRPGWRRSCRAATGCGSRTATGDGRTRRCRARGSSVPTGTPTAPCGSSTRRRSGPASGSSARRAPTRSTSVGSPISQVESFKLVAGRDPVR